MAKHPLGILLVHGIGSQPAGDTLTRWGDVLVQTIRNATRGKVAAIVERAGTGLDGTSDDRNEAVIRLEYKDQVTHWLISEGWWADSFLMPTYGELVSWSFRALPWALTTHIAQRFWLTKIKRFSKPLALTLALTKLVIALLLAPVMILVLGAILVLGLLPIPAVRGALLKTQSVLTGTLGDSLAFVESPVRAALMKTRILSGLEALQNRCDRTIVVAHSQGAAAVVECLGGIPGVDPPPAQQPDTLVTFGAGTNPLSTLRRSEGLPKALGFDPVRWATYASLGVVLSASWLALALTSGTYSILNILLAGLLWFVLLAVSIGLGFAGFKVANWLGSSRQRLAARARGAAVSGAVIVWALGTVALYLIGDREHIPAAPVVALLLSATILGTGIHAILSRQWEEMLTTVQYPPGLGNKSWIDIYTISDPVPCGPTLTKDKDRITSIEIWNEGSMFSDHVLYWRNLDAFVLRVLRACTKAATSAWQSELPAESTLVNVDARARWRVTWLHAARGAYLAMSGILAVTLFNRPPSLLVRQVAARIPSWMVSLAAQDSRDTVRAHAALLGLIVLGSWVFYAVTHAIWRWWVHKEQLAVLAQQPIAGIETRPLVAMGTTAWVGLFVSVAVTIGEPPVHANLATGLFGQVLEIGLALLLFIVVSWGLALISVWILKLLNPAPGAVPARAEVRTS